MSPERFARLQANRDRLRLTLATWRAERAAEDQRAEPVDPPPRYDQIFAEGTAWLNTI